MISKLPSGRYRARVWANGKAHNVAQVLGLPKGTTWPTKREAMRARERAREILENRAPMTITLREFWRRWTTDPMFARPKESTRVHNLERTRAFVEKHGDFELTRIGRREVDEWVAGGRNYSTVPALKAMYNDAIRHELAERNPFANLRLVKSRGNKDVKPPSQSVVYELIEAARKVSCPSFAAWLQFAAFTGMRPGEIDALRWDAIDYDRGRVLIAEQWTPRGGFTLPKNGRRREAPLTPPAREALLSQAAQHPDFCFTNLRDDHWTSSSRAYHWKATAAAVGFKYSLYVATRHHAGDYMTNVLGLPAEVVAIALGHTDGGYLVRTLYGHRDEQAALDRVIAAYERNQNVIQFKPRAEEA
jgi:integrase